MHAEQYEDYGDPEPVQMGRYTPMPQRWQRPAYARPVMHAEQYEDYGDPEPMQMGRYTPTPQRRPRLAYARPVMHAEQYEDYGDPEPMQVGRHTLSPQRRQRPTYAQPLFERRSYATSPSFAPSATSPRRSRNAAPVAASLFTMLVCVVVGLSIAVACHRQGQQQQPPQVEAGK